MCVRGGRKGTLGKPAQGTVRARKGHCPELAVFTPPCQTLFSWPRAPKLAK